MWISYFFFYKKRGLCIIISEHLKNSYTSVKKKISNFNCMHGWKKSCPISFTLVNVESITSTITVVNAAIQFHHWQIVLLLNHSWMTVTTKKRKTAYNYKHNMCQLEVVICIENWSILVLSLLGTALDNRVSQKLLGNPDYCSGATDPSFIDNCAKPINVLSQGASFDPQPEFYQQKSETMIFHNYFQQPIFFNEEPRTGNFALL